MNQLYIDQYGNRLWFLDKEWHHIGGPAYEWEEGIKFWSKKGKYDAEINNI